MVPNQIHSGIILLFFYRYFFFDATISDEIKITIIRFIPAFHFSFHGI